MAVQVKDLEALARRLERDGLDPSLVTIGPVRSTTIANWTLTGVFAGGRLVGVYGQRRDGRIQSPIAYEKDLDRWSPVVVPNPKIGPMMEGFSNLLKRPSTDLMLGDIHVQLAERDEDGDLELEILRMKSGRTFAVAAAGELGRLPSAGLVFREHNTFVSPKYRGKGLMLKLYRSLLSQGATIISDEWNHSEPMRRVWMKLAKEPGIFVFADTSNGLEDASEKPFEWPGFDKVLIAVAASSERDARDLWQGVHSELGTDWSDLAVEDHHRFSDDGAGSYF